MISRPRNVFVWLCVGAVTAGTALTTCLVLWAHDDSAVTKISAIATILPVTAIAFEHLISWRKGSAASPERDVEQLSILLARAATAQWESAAQQRALYAPIEIRWRRGPGYLPGPLEDAVAVTGEDAKFNAMPGMDPVDVGFVAAGGSQHDLLRLHGALPFGRLVIVGPAGAGKSGAAIRLAQETLRYRATLSEEDARRVPIPVSLPARNWNTDRELKEWIADQLVSSFGFLSGPRGRAEAAALVDAGRVSLFLDLDEVAPRVRPDVLGHLSKANLRVVLLARTDTMRTATLERHVYRAATVELEAVDGLRAAAYLRGAKQGSARPRGWDSLIGTLLREPAGPVARCLSSPLVLTLVCFTYGADDDLTPLLQTSPPRGRVEIERLLLARVVTAAYRTQPGRTAAVSVARATKTLSLLADRMNRSGATALAWWEIPTWCSRTPALIATTAVFTGWAFVYGGAQALPAGVMIGLAAWLVLRLGKHEPVRLVTLRWRPESLPRIVLCSLLVAAASGAAYRTQYGLVPGLLVCVVSGVAMAVAVAINAGLTGSFVTAREDTVLTVDPVASWRNDWFAGIVRGLIGGLVFGCLTGLAYGLLGDRVDPALVGGLAAPVHDTIHALAGSGVLGSTLYALLVSSLFGLSFGVVYSQTWLTRVAFLWLTLRYRTPLRLMTFLEDARRRGVLRTEGPTYVFLHAELQAALAEPAARTIPLPSPPPGRHSGKQRPRQKPGPDVAEPCFRSRRVFR